MLKRIWKDLCRSWTQHAAVQLATLTVLVATFTVVISALTVSLNMRRVLHHWGESVNMTVYLKEDVDAETRSRLEEKMAELDVFSAVEFIPKERAKSEFDKDLASILPQMMKDEAFGNPFPSSFRLGLKESVLLQNDAQALDRIVAQIASWAGVEDISYGQDWVKNYSAFLATVNRFGGVLVLVMLFGGVLVIGNGLRTSISHRREEIEILELVGATYAMIRRPYIVEGAVLGLLAGAISLGLTAAAFAFGSRALQEQLAFLSLSSQVRFLGVFSMAAVLAGCTLFGVLGSYLTVRSLNGGWSARQRVKS